LKAADLTEKRRSEVALDTEKCLTETKYELSKARKEIAFLTSNRNDVETALCACQEEKKLVERELMAIRSQL